MKIAALNIASSIYRLLISRLNYSNPIDNLVGDQILTNFIFQSFSQEDAGLRLV